MPTSPGIRYRLLTIVLLGAITSAASLFGLVHILSLSAAHRLERGRDAVAEEVDRIADRGTFAEVPEDVTVIGVRGGVASPGTIPSLRTEWTAPVGRTIEASATSGNRREEDARIGEGTLVVMAKPARSGGTAWAAYMVIRPPYLSMWQAIVILLAVATTMLVVSAIYAMVKVTREASALNRTLGALAADLATPIPPLSIRELAEVGDGVTRLARNLAASRATEEELGRELAAKERLAALGRVVAGVAHEVRNPLASIKLRLDLAAAKGDVPEPVANAVAHASREIARLDRLVADLLVVAGRSTGERVPASLAELLQARVDALAPWSSARGVSVGVRGDARANVDADSLGRAIDNLLRNAVEASREGAAVTVEIDVDGGLARVSVLDRGAGVPPGRAAELFEPFFTTKPEGTGLGLAISRAIARAHGGDVVHVRAGDVTRFELTVDGGSEAAKPVRSPSSPDTGLEAAE